MPDDGRTTDHARSGIGFLFGVLDARAVPGPILVELMGLLDVAPGTTRQLLARMLRQGDVQRERVGRVSVYQLSGRYLERWLRLRHGDARPAWTGEFQVVVYDIAESSRAHRELLLSTAVRAGFAQLRPGLLIGLRPPDFLADLRDDHPADAAVEVGALAVDLPAAQRMASRAWQLPEVAAELRRATEALHSLLADNDTGPPGGHEALDRLWQAILLAGRPRYQAPLLPSDLVPSDWPADQVQRLFSAVVDRHRMAAGHFLAEILATSPYAHLVRGGWWPEVSQQLMSASA